MSIKIRAIAKRLILDYVLGKFATFTALADAIGISQVFDKILTKRPSDTAGASDEIGPFEIGKNLSEEPSIIDTPAKTFSTGRDDAFDVTDNDTLTIGKVFDEAIKATDDFDGTATPEDDQEINFGKIIVQPTFVSESIDIVASYNREFSDSSSASEQLANTLTKVFTDQVDASESIFVTRAKLNEDTSGVTENAIFDFGKSLSDSGIASEDVTFSVSKALSELPSVSESASLSFTASRSDSASVSETNTLTFGSIKSDLALISEASVISAEKVISDQPVVTEAKAFSQAKAFTDGGITVDLPVKSIGQTFTEVSSANDDGSLRSQGYCDFDYFAEDYVGQSRTFT